MNARRGRAKVATYYRDRRGCCRDGETHRVISKAVAKGRREVAAPVDREVSRAAAEDLSDASPPPAASTRDTSEVAELPDAPPIDAAPAEPSTAIPAAPVVEPAAGDAVAELPDAPAPPVDPSPAPATPAIPPVEPSTAPSTVPSTAPSTAPSAATANPSGIPVVEPFTAPSTAPSAAQPAQAPGSSGPLAGTVDECPHCETDLRVCPRCNREYAPVPVGVAQTVGWVVGRVTGAITRGIAGRRYGVDPGPVVLSQGELEMLTSAAHGILRRRLPARAGGAVGDLVAGAFAVVGVAACQFDDVVQRAREPSRETSRARNDGSPPPAAPEPAPAPSPPAAPLRFDVREAA